MVSEFHTLTLMILSHSLKEEDVVFTLKQCMGRRMRKSPSPATHEADKRLSLVPQPESLKEKNKGRGESVSVSVSRPLLAVAEPRWGRRLDIQDEFRGPTAGKDWASLLST